MGHYSIVRAYECLDETSEDLMSLCQTLHGLTGSSLQVRMLWSLCGLSSGPNIAEYLKDNIKKMVNHLFHYL